MKKQINYLLMLVALAVTGVFTSCSPDDYSLASPAIIPAELVEGISYTVTPDPNNPNILVCKSDLGAGRNVAWQTPFGLTKGDNVTLQIPFPGEYEVKFGVDTGNGFVWGAPFKFTVSDICTDFISGETWEMLAGGVGKSKTWVYDNGQVGCKEGALSYGDPAANPSLGFHNFVDNWTPGYSENHCSDAAMYDSYMVFDLDNGANYSWYNSSTGETQTGTYSFNEQSYTVEFVGAELMHPSTWDQRLLDWRKGFQIVELSENQLRIAYIRIAGTWGGEWVECFNYVSKDYLDNYVVPEPSGIQIDPALLAALSTEMKYAAWKIDEEVPYDWFTIDGNRKNPSWQTASGYPAAYKPTPDSYSDFNIIFCSPAVNDYKTSSLSGTYTLSDNGLFTLSNGIDNLSLGAGVELKTGDGNTLQVLAVDVDDVGRVTDLWLGAMEKDMAGKDIEYLGYHFVASYGGGSSLPSFALSINYNNTNSWSAITGPTVYTSGDGVYELSLIGSNQLMDPCVWIDCAKILGKYPNCAITIMKIVVDGKEIPFVDGDISKDVGDVETTARRYVCNPWGLAACFNGDKTLFLFDSEIKITVDVKYDTGTPFH